MAGDLLDEVDFPRHVDPTQRHLHVPRAVPGGVRREAEPFENVGHERGVNRRAEQMADARVAQPHPRRRAGLRIAIDDRSDRLGGADLPQELAAPLQGSHRRRHVGAALEPIRCIRAQGEALARASDRHRLEVGALERDATGGGVDLRVGTAHDTGHRLRSLGIGNDQHVLGQRPVLAIQGTEALARAGAPDTQLPTTQPVEVEGVHRVPQLEQHVVGHVDDVVDGSDAGRLEAPRQPRGRRADRDLGDRRGVARAKLGILQGDRELGQPSGRGHRLGRGDRERGAIHRRDFARDAGDAQAVRPVRRDFEIQDGVAGRAARWRRLGRGYLEAPHVESVRERCHVDWHRDEIAEPGQLDSHAGNCSRKRRSFS